MGKKTIFIFLIVINTAFYVHAQQSPDFISPVDSEEKTAPTAEKQGQAASATATATATATGNVSLDFRDADIRNVLRVLSFKSGVNIVVGPEVAGTVSIQLKNVPWKQALDVILTTYGYGYEQKGNVITVTTIENLKQRRLDKQVLSDQETLQTKTFILNFGKSEEIVSTLEGMKSDRGSISLDSRTNTLIVTDTLDSLENMEEVIAKLDSITPQVLIEAKIVETTLNNSENLGVDWLMQVTATGAKRSNMWPFMNNTDNQYLDDPFPGADRTVPDSTKANLNFSYGTLNFTQLQSVFEILRTRTDTNILSNPRIVTLDNQMAKIIVGVDYPIPNYSFNQETGSLQVSGFTWRNIGVIFEVTPSINSSGFVTLDVTPEVSEMVGEVPFDNINLPLISKEQAQTKVMVKDGETLVIAGLIKDSVTDTEKKVPFLGSIPLVGRVFNKTDKTVVKTDLLIFITPRIITAEVSDIIEK